MTPKAQLDPTAKPAIPNSARRFWERARLPYNLALIATVIFWIAISWPHFRPAMTLSSLAKLAILALIANVLYCAAYLADLAIQHLPNAARLRWILFSLGTLAAVFAESYWINDEIYPEFAHAILILRSLTQC